MVAGRILQFKVRTKAYNIKFILTHLFQGATAREPK